MKTIIFLDTNYSGSSRDAIKAAHELGYHTILLTNRPYLISRKQQMPDVSKLIPVNLSDKNTIKATIVKLNQTKPIAAIVSFIDQYVYLAAKLAEEMNINRLTLSAIQIMHDKIKMRKLLENTPFDLYYDVFPGNNVDDFIQRNTAFLPLIIKAPQSTGSKDVLLASSADELLQNTLHLFKKYPNQSLLAEEFIPGPQYLVEALVYHSHVYIIAVIHQETTTQPPFIITGYSVMVTLPELFYSSIEQAVHSLISLTGMHYGACHLELRYSNKRWQIIEINPRISGGAMNKMIEEATGINLVKQTLQLITGFPPDIRQKHQKFVFTRYLVSHITGILEKVTGKNRALRLPGVCEVYIKPRKGALLTPPYSMGQRYAYVMALGNSPYEARHNADQAAQEISFVLKPYSNQKT